MTSQKTFGNLAVQSKRLQTNNTSMTTTTKEYARQSTMEERWVCESETRRRKDRC